MILTSLSRSQNGAVAGNNTKPQWIEVAHNTMSHIGQILIHVSGVALRCVSL